MNTLNILIMIQLVYCTVKSYYVAGPQVLSFNDAENYCITRGGHLASVNNNVEHEETISICQNSNANVCWIGLSQEGFNGAWGWTDASEIDYGFYNNNGNSPTTGLIPWYKNEPNDYSGIGSENCVSLWSAQGPYDWNDSPCSDRFIPICKIDPKYYYFVGEQVLSFSDAEDYCIANGATLASVTNNKEREETKKLCENIKADSCWIGLSQEGINGAWSWTDGSQIDYGFNNNDGNSPTTGIIPWYSNEPNDYTGFGSENCVTLWSGQNYDWNDSPCSNLYEPICKGQM